jgi:hypothetical protein
MQTYVAACKKFLVPEDFRNEKRNIEILKESLTHHGNIMLHLSTVEHVLEDQAPNHYILLLMLIAMILNNSCMVGLSTEKKSINSFTCSQGYHERIYLYTCSHIAMEPPTHWRGFTVALRIKMDQDVCLAYAWTSNRAIYSL